MWFDAKFSGKFALFVLAVASIVLVTQLGVLTGTSFSMFAVSYRNHEQSSGKKLHFTVPTHYGKDQLIVKYAASIANETKRLVRFKEVQTTCGCSAASLRKMELVPGEKTFLDIEVDMTRFGGKRKTSCLLLVENGETWKCEFGLTAYPILQFEQNREHLAFKEVAMGQVVEKTMHMLYSPDRKSVSLANSCCQMGWCVCCVSTKFKLFNNPSCPKIDIRSFPVFLSLVFHSGYSPYPLT